MKTINRFMKAMIDRKLHIAHIQRWVTERLISLPFLIILGFWLPIQGMGTEATVIKEGFESLKLGKSLELFIDESNTMTLEQVRSPENADQWFQSKVDVPSFGYQTGAVWAHFNITDNRNKTEPLILELSYAIVDFVDLYEIKDKTVTHMKGGNKYPSNQRSQLSRFPSFLLENERNYNIYIRISGEGSKRFPLAISTYENQNANNQNWLIFQALYYGALVAMVLYNFLVGLGTRMYVYFSYVGFLLGFALFQLALHGLGEFIIWPTFNWFTIPALFIGMAFLGVMSHLFTIQLLGIQKDYKYCRYFNRYLIINAFFTSPILLYWQGYKVAILCYILFTIIPWGITLIGYGFLAFKRKEEVALWYAISWFFFIIGSLFAALKPTGWVPDNSFTTHAQQIGSLLEFILLSFALAQRIKSLQRKALEAETKAREADARALEEERRLLQELEMRVEIVAGLAHRMNNPLHYICTSLPVLTREAMELSKDFNSMMPESEENREVIDFISRRFDTMYMAIQNIQVGANRSRASVTEICSLSGVDGFQVEYIKIQELLNDVNIRLQEILDENNFASIEFDTSSVTDRKVACNQHAVVVTFEKIMKYLFQNTKNKPNNLKVAFSEDENKTHVNIRLFDKKAKSFPFDEKVISLISYFLEPYFMTIRHRSDQEHQDISLALPMDMSIFTANTQQKDENFTA